MTVSFRKFRFYLLALTVVGLGFTLVGCGSGDNDTFITSPDGTLIRRTSSIPSNPLVQSRYENGHLDVAVGIVPNDLNADDRDLRPEARSLSWLPDAGNEVRGRVSPNESFAGLGDALEVQTVRYNLSGDTLVSVGIDPTYPADQKIDVFLSDGFINRTKAVPEVSGGEEWEFTWSNGGSVQDATITFKLSPDRTRLTYTIEGGSGIGNVIHDGEAVESVNLRSVLLLEGCAGLSGPASDFTGPWTVTDNTGEGGPAQFTVRNLEILDFDGEVVELEDGPQAGQNGVVFTGRVEGSPDWSSLQPARGDAIFVQIDVRGAFGAVRASVIEEVGLGPNGDFAITWDGTDDNGNRIGDPSIFAYRAMAGLRSPGSSPSPGSRVFTAVSRPKSTSFVVGDIGPFRIEDVDIFYLDFPGQNGEEGIVAEITADFRGLDEIDISIADVSWSVDILDSEGNVIDDDFATGGGSLPTNTSVFACWNGIDDNGNFYETFQDLENAGLNVRVTASLCFEVEEPLPTTGSFILPDLDGIGYFRNEVVRGQDMVCQLPVEGYYVAQETSRGKIRVSGSSLLALGAGQTTPLTPQERSQQQELLKKVFPLGLAQANPNLTVIVEELDFGDSPPPSTITLSVKAPSGEGKEVPLTRLATGNVYVGPVALDGDVLRASPPGINKSFTKSLLLGETSNREPIDAALTNVSSYVTTLSLGTLTEELVNPADTASDANTAMADADNLKANGFETVEFSVRGPGVGGGKVTAELKVRNPANVVFWVHHGSEINGQLNLTRDSVNGRVQNVPVIQVTPGNSGIDLNPNLETVFLSSCGALCFRDYNNNVTRGGRDATDNITARDYGGLNWLGPSGLSTNPNSDVVLLGYNFWASQELVLPVISAYRQEMNRLIPLVPQSGDDLEISNVQQIAWLLANIRTASTSNAATRDLGFNACAIDGRHYYYIPRVHTRTRPQPRPGGGVEIHRIARSFWTQEPTNSWADRKKSYADIVRVP